MVLAAHLGADYEPGLLSLRAEGFPREEAGFER